MQLKGGVETGSMYNQYVKGIQPNVPAGTTCKPILYNIYPYPYPYPFPNPNPNVSPYNYVNVGKKTKELDTKT